MVHVIKTTRGTWYEESFNLVDFNFTQKRHSFRFYISACVINSSFKLVGISPTYWYHLYIHILSGNQYPEFPGMFENGC